MTLVLSHTVLYNVWAQLAEFIDRSHSLTEIFSPIGLLRRSTIHLPP